MARWSSKLNLLLTATDSLSGPVRGASSSVSGFGRAADRSSQALRQFGMQAGRVVSDMHNFAGILNITSAGALMIGNRLDKVTTSLAAQTGGTRREVNALQESMTMLAASTAGSLDTVTQITTALGESGETLGENADVLVRLVDTWGLSAHSAGQLRKSADVLNLSFKGLLNTTVGYQKAFKLPGMVAQLPAAMNFATKSVTQFSRSVVHDEKQVIETTMKTGAVISRAFGKPFSEGLQMAQQHFSTFSDALENTRNVFLGIDDGFGAMQTTLFEAGLGIDQVTEKLKQGQEDPIEYAKSLNQIYERLKATASPWYAERFLANAKKSSSEVVRLYLSDGKKLAAADEARAMANQLAGGDWEKMTEAMRANADTAITGFHDMLSLAKEVVSLGFADIITEIFGGKEGVTKTFQDLNKWIITVKTTFMKGDLYEKGFKPVLVGLGKLVVYLTTASGILGPLAFGFGAVLNVVKFLASPLELLAKGGDAAVGAFGTLADMLGNAALAIAGFSMAIPGLNFVLVPLFGLLGVGLKGAGLGLSGFSAVGIKNFAIITAGFAALGKFVKGTWAPTLDGAIKDVEGSFSDIGKFLDESLGGIPTQLMNYFFPQDEEKLIKKYKMLGVELYRGSKTKALWFINDKGEWERAGLTLQERFENLGQKVKGYLEQWKKDKTLVPAMNSLFTDMGDSIDTALEGGPTRIANALFGKPGEEKTFGQRAGAVGEAIGEAIEIFKDRGLRNAWIQGNILGPLHEWLKDNKETLRGIGNDIGTGLGAGMSIIKSILGLSEEASLEDELHLRFVDIGKDIAEGLLEGLKGALTARALLKALPALHDLLLSYHGMKAIGSPESAREFGRLTKLRGDFEREAETDRERSLAADRAALPGRTLRKIPSERKALEERLGVKGISRTETTRLNKQLASMSNLEKAISEAKSPEQKYALAHEYRGLHTRLSEERRGDVLKSPGGIDVLKARLDTVKKLLNVESTAQWQKLKSENPGKALRLKSLARSQYDLLERNIRYIEDTIAQSKTVGGSAALEANGTSQSTIEDWVIKMLRESEGVLKLESALSSLNIPAPPPKPGPQAPPSITDSMLSGAEASLKQTFPLTAAGMDYVGGKFVEMVLPDVIRGMMDSTMESPPAVTPKALPPTPVAPATVPNKKSDKDAANEAGGHGMAPRREQVGQQVAVILRSKDDLPFSEFTTAQWTTEAKGLLV